MTLQPMLAKFHRSKVNEDSLQNDADDEDADQGPQADKTQQTIGDRARKHIIAVEKSVQAVEHAAHIEEKVWAKFDMFFGFFVILNGALMGAQAEAGQSDKKITDPEADGSTWTWYIIECAFFFIFFYELCMRAALVYQ